MSIGAGIAIAGAWGFAAACALSKQVTGNGMMLGMIAALIATAVVAAAS